MPYEPEQKWLLEPAKYYEEERGVQLFETWNKIVKLQLQLIDAKMQGDMPLFLEIWNECIRMRRTIIPFVSKDGTLFSLASIFDNIAHVGMQYIVNQFKVMERMSFLIEILNYVVDRVDNCYYKIDERHKYYNATNDSFIRDFAENTDFSWQQLARQDSRYDLDCNPNAPLEICFDWGSAASFMEVAQPSNYDFVNKVTVIGRTVDNTINEFFVRRDDEDDTPDGQTDAQPSGGQSASAQPSGAQPAGDCGQSKEGA